MLDGEVDSYSSKDTVGKDMLMIADLTETAMEREQAMLVKRKTMRCATVQAYVKGYSRKGKALFDLSRLDEDRC
jgi:hypothetical protein